MDTINNQSAISTGEKASEARPEGQAGTSEPQADKKRQGSGGKSQAKNASPTKHAKSDTKAAKILKLLRSKKGASIKQLEAETGWQAHSVRGFLSGTVKKKLRLTVTSEVDKDGVRRYRVGENAKAG